MSEEIEITIKVDPDNLPTTGFYTTGYSPDGPSKILSDITAAVAIKKNDIKENEIFLFHKPNFAFAFYIASEVDEHKITVRNKSMPEGMVLFKTDCIKVPNPLQSQLATFIKPEILRAYKEGQV